MPQLIYSKNNAPSPAELNSVDLNSLTPVELNASFLPGRDYIDTTVYGTSGEFLYDFRLDSNLTALQLNAGETSDTIYIDPTSLFSDELENGVGSVLYSFFRPLLIRFLVAEISSDRTELKLKPLDNRATYEDIVELRSIVTSSKYYSKVGIKIGQGDYVPIINVDELDGSPILKLYEALPSQVTVNQQIEIIQEVANPISYNFSIIQDPIIEEVPYLRGPNFNIDTDEQSNLTTEYLDYNELYGYPVTGSYSKIFSEVKSTTPDINVDFTDFNNFIHFSSAKERLANFRYKLILLETYTAEKAEIQNLSSASLAISSSDTYYDNLIKGILTKFDSYERYLYYESSSKAWPKSNSEEPYLNVSSSNAAAVSWYAAEYASASLYDELNESNLEYTIPEYIRQDSSNAPYSLFTNMIGQHFDDLWLYAKDYTNKYNSDNRLDYGISKDLIAKTLQNFGIKLYSSNFAIGNLTSLLLGEWYDSGSETINTFVTASNKPTPDKDILTETYKRIYHNLPYLIKTKGTERGLRALVNTFGIPSSSLSIFTYGGVERPGSTPYFASTYPTGSKIRVENTGSIVPGNTLSQYVSIQKDDRKFTQDQHIVEAGFSPTYNIDNYILDNITGSFNIDQYIGDPRYLYSKAYNNDTNGNLKDFAETLLSGSDAYDVFDFIRLIKFFDNQLFKMVKDFLPARDVTTSGIIIKPHLLNRSKVQSVQATYTRPEYTASIDTLFVTGSDGGVINEYSTAHTASVLGLLGTVTEIRNTEVEKINGELGGSLLDIYGKSLNEANVLKVSPNDPLLVYTSSGSGQTNPPAGEFYWRKGDVRGSGNSISGIQVKYIYINEIDENGVNIENALTNLQPGDKITFTVKYDNQGIVGA